MPFDKRKTDSGWEVINSDTGDVKGIHESEAEADDQLEALYANIDPESEKENMEKANFFIPITKVNAERREVWGWGAIEEPDNSDEILDYVSSKPHFLDWSNRAQKRSGGKSMGNVRAMHKNVAAGKLIELRPDDVSKGFYVGAKIVDDQEWKKVEQGVYTGFSVGGSYLKRWQDFSNPGKIRYTAKPTELSIVDSPCIPSATFEMVKADGVTETMEFQAGSGENEMELDIEDEVEEEDDHDLEDKELEKHDEDVKKIEIGDVMDKLEKIYSILDNFKMELQKAIPSSPEPVADIPLTGEYGSENVDQMPPPSVLLEIEPNAEPSQEVLATHAVNAQELTSAIDAWLPKIGVLVKDAVQIAFDEMEQELKKVNTNSVPERTILVKRSAKQIKVVRKE